MSEKNSDSKVDRLGDLAVQLSWIQSKDLTAALKIQTELKANGTYKPLGHILVELHKLSEGQLKQLLERQSELWEGHRVLGRYRLLAKIGEGGMGAVWKAEHVELGNAVAIKLLPRSLIGDQALVKRFEREARVLAGINHTNIVQAFDAGEHDGQPYFVMPYVNGASLGELLRSCGVLDVRIALSITLQILRGLQYAHDRGIIHRDLKPDNIALTNDGTVKILDLGLTKIMEQSVTDGQFTAGSDLILGTPYHMSPEQILCDPNLDRRSDLYSLGSTLFQMICGRVPFYGESIPDVLRKKLDRPPPDPQDFVPSIAPGVRKLILRLMARSPDNRPQSAAFVESWVEELLDNRPLTGSRLSPGKIALGQTNLSVPDVQHEQAAQTGHIERLNETASEIETASADGSILTSTPQASETASFDPENAVWKKSTGTEVPPDAPLPFHNPATTTMMPPFIKEFHVSQTQRTLESTKRTYRPVTKTNSTRIIPPTSRLNEFKTSPSIANAKKSIDKDTNEISSEGWFVQCIAVGILIVIIGFIVITMASAF